MKYLYDGFHKIEAVKAVVNGEEKEFEKLILKSAVAGLVIDDDGCMCLVKQHRPAVGHDTLEIPAGVLDKPGLSEIETLIEELQEECNIPLEDISYYGNSPLSKYYMVVGSTDATCAIYQISVKDQSLNDSFVLNDDVTSVHWYDAKEVTNLVERGEIKDPKTLIAINHYLYDYLAING